MPFHLPCLLRGQDLDHKHRLIPYVVFEVNSHREREMSVFPYIAVFVQVRACQWTPAIVGIRGSRC